MRVRVLVWNVWGFRRGVVAAADVVRSVGPEILLLQETGHRGRLADFVRELDLRVAGESAPRLYPRPVLDAVCVRKPWAIDDWRLERFPGASRWAPRGAAVADLGLGPARLRAISTHLGLDHAERVDHTGSLLGLIDGYDGPAVLGGDLNARPHQDAAMMLGERLHDVWIPAVGPGRTYPASSPEARIDYLYVSGQVEVLDADVVSTDASDHLPVVADLELPAG